MMTTTSNAIKKAIEKIPRGDVFTYKDLPHGRTPAATQLIYRMLKKGELGRFRKGIFYRPIKGYKGGDDIFSAYEGSIIERYTHKNGRRVGYLSGLSLFNYVGLSTQMYFVVEVASHLPIPKINSHTIKLRPLKSYVKVTEKNYQKLRFLDLLRFFKPSPMDVDEEIAIGYFIKQLKKMNVKERQELITLALSYPPRVRALLGALLEEGKMKRDLKKLRESLNPLSLYKLHTRWYYLPASKKWNLYDEFVKRRKRGLLAN